MKKYTCPECGKTFFNRKPNSCPQCGCLSEMFVETELIKEPENQPVQQPQVQPQVQYVVVQPTQQGISVEGLVKSLSVILLIIGIVGGLIVLIAGIIEASKYHVSVIPAAISGIAIIFASIFQYGLIRIFVKISERLKSIDSKIK